MIRARDDDAAAGRRIVAAIVLAGGKHPRQHGANGDARDEQDHGMRQLHGRDYDGEKRRFTNSG